MISRMITWKTILFQLGKLHFPFWRTHMTTIYTIFTRPEAWHSKHFFHVEYTKREIVLIPPWCNISKNFKFPWRKNKNHFKGIWIQVDQKFKMQSPYSEVLNILTCLKKSEWMFFKPHDDLRAVLFLMWRGIVEGN